MFIILSTLNQTRRLAQYIDNKDGNWHVGVKDIYFRNGMFNVKEKVVMEGHPSPGNRGSSATLKAGNYTIKELKNFLLTYFKRILLNKNSGKLTLVLNTTKWSKVIIPKEFSHLLGFHGQTEFTKEFNKSTASVDLLPCSTLNFSLQDVDGVFLDEQSSSVIKSIPYPETAFATLYSVTFKNPEFYKITKDVMTDITLHLRDERGDVIDNHGLPVYVLLQFKKI